MRPSLLIAAGLLAGQGTVYLATPLLSRLYSPNEIGTAAAMMAAAGVISAVATLRLELMLPGAADGEVRWLVQRASISMIIVSVILSPVAGFALGLSALNTVLTALTAIGISSVAVSLQAASRVRELRGVAAAKGVQGVGQTVAQITLATYASPIGMQAGAAIGLLAAGGVQAVSVRRRIRALPVVNFEPMRVRAVIRNALWLTLAAVCNAAVVASLPLLTQMLFDESATGEVAVAQRLALAPAGLAVAAVLPVVIAQFGVHARTDLGAGRALVLRWLRRLIPVGVVATSVLLVAPLLPLAALLGPGWEDVGYLLAAMSPQIGAQLVAGPLSQCLVIQKREMVQLVWDASRMVAVFGSAAIVAFTGGEVVSMVWAVSTVLFVAYAVYIWLVLARGAKPHS